MKESGVPEEKLLRLIRGEKKTDPAFQDNIPAPMQTPLNPAQAAHKKTKKEYFAGLKELPRILQSKKIVLVAFCLPILFLIVSFLYPLMGLPRISLQMPPEEKIDEPLVQVKQEPKQLEFYLEGAKTRSIFMGLASENSAATAIISDTESIKDLTLVGIISGENPQAIIEDRKAQKNYTVSQGQYIGSFKVEEFLEGKIILSAKGQRYELTI